MKRSADLRNLFSKSLFLESVRYYQSYLGNKNSLVFKNEYMKCSYFHVNIFNGSLYSHTYPLILV